MKAPKISEGIYLKGLHKKMELACFATRLAHYEFIKRKVKKMTQNVTA